MRIAVITGGMGGRPKGGIGCVGLAAPRLSGSAAARKAPDASDNALAARAVPFVFSTGYNKDSLPKSYQSFPVLQKPFDRLKLGDTLAKLLTPEEPGVR